MPTPTHNRPGKLLMLSLLLNLVLAVALMIALNAVYVAYTRSLVAQQPVAPLMRGNSDVSGLLFIGDSRISDWANYDAFNAGYLGFRGASSHQIEAWLNSQSNTHKINAPSVILQLGINDLRLIGVAPSRASSVIKSTVNSLETATRRLAERYDNVVLCGLFPVGDARLIRKPVWSNEIGAAVAEVNRRLARTDWPVNVTFLDLTTSFTPLGQEAFKDELHFTGEAYDALNKALRDRLDGEMFRAL